MFYTVTDTVCLQQLGCVYKGREAVGIFVGLLHITHDLSVCTVLTLMLLHDIGEGVHILFVIRKLLNRFHRRECLETKLRQIAEEVFAVLGERTVSVPYLPVMYVAAVRIVRLVQTTA